MDKGGHHLVGVELGIIRAVLVAALEIEFLELVAGEVDLNALGVGPRDLISILQSIKAAGALQADLEVR